MLNELPSNPKIHQESSQCYCNPRSFTRGDGGMGAGVSNQLSTVASRERELGEFGSDRRLCNRIRLWELPDQYVLEPADGTSPSQCVAISRDTGDITLLGAHLHLFRQVLKVSKIFNSAHLSRNERPRNLRVGIPFSFAYLGLDYDSVLRFLAQVMCRLLARTSVCIRRKSMESLASFGCLQASHRRVFNAL